MHSIFAEADLAATAGKYVMYVLAVAGGFMVGNILTWIVCRLAAKLILKQSINRRLEQALRIVGGIIVAVVVAYLLFQFGPGWGLGGTGKSEGQDNGGQTPAADAKGNIEPKLDTKSKAEEAILATSLRVTVQKATDYPKTFRFDGETEGFDLAKAKAKLMALRDRSDHKLQLLEIRVYKDSTEAGHPDVREFLDYANQLGIHTRVEKLGTRPE